MSNIGWDKDEVFQTIVDRYPVLVDHLPVGGDTSTVALPRTEYIQDLKHLFLCKTCKMHNNITDFFFFFFGGGGGGGAQLTK